MAESKNFNYHFGEIAYAERNYPPIDWLFDTHYMSYTYSKPLSIGVFSVNYASETDEYEHNDLTFTFKYPVSVGKFDVSPVFKYNSGGESNTSLRKDHIEGGLNIKYAPLQNLEVDLQATYSEHLAESSIYDGHDINYSSSLTLFLTENTALTANYSERHATNSRPGNNARVDHDEVKVGFRVYF